MSATIISLQERQASAAIAAGIGLPSSTAIEAATLELWRRHDELLSVLEGLRQPDLEVHTLFAPQIACLEATVVRTIAEVGLLIRRAERLSAGLT
ncbi:hypothetical protein [Methylobacterium sp. J-076]|uniref:hypothetical protein n=1 Tax=Methylobacterium sp. J-076 TaxID=2836655 RepID=UPI001FB96F7C|nr:hypothetical protein [Methylobacterium sp. J-076]MCJ2011764.1 hypothetical protein [Methylobacterium sp. J-076]